MLNSRRARFLTGLLSVGLLASACGNNADDTATETQAEADPSEFSEEELAAFYDDEDINVIISTATGAGTNAAGRLVAEYMTKHTPGNPDVIVENIEGSAGLQGTNEYVFNRPDDGLETLVVGSSRTLEWALEAEGVEYDLTELEALWAIPSSGVVYTHADGPVQELADLEELDEPLYYAGGQAVGDRAMLLAMDGLNIELNAMLGYEGRGPSRIAFLQGESDINYDTPAPYLENIQPEVDAGDIVPLFSLGYPDDDGGIDRDPAFPELPHIGEAYEEITGEAPSGDFWDAYNAIFTAGVVANTSMWIHESSPAEARAALKLGLERTAEDPDFQEELNTMIGENSLYVGDTLDNVIQNLYELPGNESLDYLREVIDSES